VEVKEGGVAGCEVHVVEGAWVISLADDKSGNKNSTYLREVLG
jgi:hypothetical protein